MAAETFARYDSAEYLKTEKDVAAYLEACMQEGGDDPAFMAHALGVVARAQNISRIARETGLSREGIYKALSADGNPSLATVMKVAGALGIELRFQLSTAPRRERAARKAATRKTAGHKVAKTRRAA
jgi:probable addiction module antidote protein